MEGAIAAAPPDRAGPLALKLMPMAQRLEEAWRKEQAMRAPADMREEARLAALQMRALDEEVGRLIEERAREKAAFLLSPPAYEYDNRAKAVARMEGGAWETYLPRVREEQRAYVKRLLAAAEGEAQPPEGACGAFAPPPIADRA